MKTYEDFVRHLKKITDINAASAVLHWDKEVNMPPGGSRFRAQQLATLSGLSHNHFVKEEFGDLLDNLSKKDSLNDKQSSNVERTLEDYEKATKLDEEFVVNRSKAISACHEAWLNSRRRNDSSEFLDKLDPLIDLKREEAERLGYEEHPYDALLDQYEPGLDTATCERIFGEIKDRLLPFTEAIRTKMPDQPPSWLSREVEESVQLKYGRNLCEQLGYDYDRGRQDLSEHPFTTSFSADDVRITTRVETDNFSNMLWSTIHELGHALYEQGLPAADYGLPSGQAASLAIHESQARLWENQVGRSQWFWSEHFPAFKSYFSPVFDDLNFDEFIKGINHVAPGFIRTDSDELHYHLHILIRYEIEKGIMESKIEASDIPQIWNEKYRHYLNLEIPNDNKGILQDIHWAHGSIGYFPTYSLGSLYAAQFFDALMEDSSISESVQKGMSESILEWLRTHVHSKGRQYYPEDLCERITGSRLSIDPFLQYADRKYGTIVG